MLIDLRFEHRQYAQRLCSYAATERQFDQITAIDMLCPVAPVDAAFFAVVLVSAGQAGDGVRTGHVLEVMSFIRCPTK